MSDSIKVPDGYSFIKPINSGGFGSVVEMMENSTQKHYAGKMIPCVTPKDKERIAREVSRLRKFAHPGIVGLKEVASMDNSKVIVMELGGQSLADIVRDHRSRGVLVAREVVYRVMVDVSSALNLMHNHESGATAHGDVKMENILLFPGGHFKLCDLGAAESENGSSSHSVTTQLYMSPERMESETGRATCSSDVWALGIILHWLLFGEPPFKSQNVVRLIQEITSFKASMIGESCGGEERVLLIRMLDPNSGSRVTSSQLCTFGVFRCLVNTPSALWRLKDADNKEFHSEVERLRTELEKGKYTHQQDQEKMIRMEAELKTEQTRTCSLTEEVKAKDESIVRLERELAESRSNQIQPSPPPPTANKRLHFSPPHRSPSHQLVPPATPPQPAPTPPLEQQTPGTGSQSQIGAAAIELFHKDEWIVSGDVFTKATLHQASLVSFEFGAVVARLSLTIRNGLHVSITVGIISPSQTNEALTRYFPCLKGGAGWNLYNGHRVATQNQKMTNNGSACLGGRVGQRVVLEADGRDGRTLKLSQDGETQPVFFTNIPVPFRFAVFTCHYFDAVEIESVNVVSEPQMVGGTIAVPMDE
ncbi:putative Calcium/calmodulin-dependent protein kinase type II delta chain [Blattamonas nauphoetae]|uniref:non-specific serine/threonine protein kinase n=1 Tax=Blattamonas nauphoetae TaxID=2049346 RepID=A0ABQ9WUC1_9EUKA|nr:putative Calcium/calmodulin-dependent protein kinase type II delta chain [Blattamonas nauphoetae]